MGYYAGPAPEIDEEAWQRARAHIQAAMDKVKEENKRIAFPMFGPARLASVIAELFMSQTNTNKQTPRPNVTPPSQHPTREQEMRAVLDRAEAAGVFPLYRPAQESRRDAQGNRTSATGPTQRLVCRTCGDTLPPNARFCIECGATL